jgi:hypothetical protein
VGSFKDQIGIENNFYVARVLRVNVIVNQFVSMLLDPAKLVCISCKKEHGILGCNPLFILFFVPSLPDSEGRCVHIVRLENASLELS